MSLYVNCSIHTFENLDSACPNLPCIDQPVSKRLEHLPSAANIHTNRDGCHLFHEALFVVVTVSELFEVASRFRTSTCHRGQQPGRSLERPCTAARRSRSPSAQDQATVPRGPTTHRRHMPGVRSALCSNGAPTQQLTMGKATGEPRPCRPGTWMAMAPEACHRRRWAYPCSTGKVAGPITPPLARPGPGRRCPPDSSSPPQRRPAGRAHRRRRGPSRPRRGCRSAPGR